MQTLQTVVPSVGSAAPSCVLRFVHSTTVVTYKVGLVLRSATVKIRLVVVRPTAVANLHVEPSDVVTLVNCRGVDVCSSAEQVYTLACKVIDSVVDGEFKDRINLSSSLEYVTAMCRTVCQWRIVCICLRKDVLTSCRSVLVGKVSIFHELTHQVTWNTGNGFI